MRAPSIVLALWLAAAGCSSKGSPATQTQTPAATAAPASGAAPAATAAPALTSAQRRALVR